MVHKGGFVAFTLRETYNLEQAGLIAIGSQRQLLFLIWKGPLT